MPDLHRIPLNTLHRYPGNPRRGDIPAIRASLTANGQFAPLVVQTSRHRVLAGNHTLEAMLAEGWTEADAYLLDVDDTTAARIVLAANRTADLGAYDTADLTALLQTLPTLDGTGYSPADLDALLRDQPTALPYTPEQADQAPPLPAEPTARLGDLYRAGRHWVACIDATNPDHVTALTAHTGLADAIWTDPPYGVDYVGGNHAKTSKQRRAAGEMTIRNDGAKNLPAFLRALFETTRTAVHPGSPIYVANPAGRINVTFFNLLTDTGYDIRQGLVWVKQSMVLGHSDYHYRHEPIWYGYTPWDHGRLGRGAKHWYGDHAQTTVFQIDRPSRSSDHPTMKPVALITAMLRNSLRPGGTVYDPCAGSGSTLIAADTLASTAICADIDPRYVDVILARYQTLTGITPTRHARLLEPA